MQSGDKTWLMRRTTASQRLPIPSAARRGGIQGRCQMRLRAHDRRGVSCHMRLKELCRMGFASAMGQAIRTAAGEAGSAGHQLRKQRLTFPLPCKTLPRTPRQSPHDRASRTERKCEYYCVCIPAGYNNRERVHYWLESIIMVQCKVIPLSHSPSLCVMQEGSVCIQTESPKTPKIRKSKDTA